ncbi:MAG: site-specific DNA-methyltransferase [Propionibacterium sp.]|nr:site-specific DNA-methyltransferase [Propionibacterium sp.]
MNATRTPEPSVYYSDDSVTLWHGDCRQVTAWLDADVLVTDPPYGRSWRSGSGMTNSEGRGRGSKPHGGIVGDDDTTSRDEALALWGDRLAVVFGDPLIDRPARTVQALVYAKPLDAGVKGARAGFRRDVEMVWLVGPWPVQVGGRSSVIRTNGLVAGPRGVATRYGHPHAKPVDVMELLVDIDPGVIADPFAGSGSTLVAAKRQGRRAIGVEIDERYCEVIAKRLSQGILDFAGGAA